MIARKCSIVVEITKIIMIEIVGETPWFPQFATNDFRDIKSRKRDEGREKTLFVLHILT